VKISQFRQMMKYLTRPATGKVRSPYNQTKSSDVHTPVQTAKSGQEKYPKIMVDQLSPTGYQGLTPEDDKLLAKKDKVFESYIDRKQGVDSLFKKKEASPQQLRDLKVKADKYLNVHGNQKRSEVLDLQVKPVPVNIDMIQRDRLEQERRLADEKQFNQLIKKRVDPDYYKGLAQILGVTPEKEQQYNESIKSNRNKK
tara:strand:- start:361 stop:954 length:594 start_codon:yes stop_codon:yes gene_type:complete